ncbi:MAG TPA: cation:proton antiporter, partial [Pyrinomonadaceae bacterium]|nr:cation:proton antiporter [Pyrinomonadaceae bacterium]
IEYQSGARPPHSKETQAMVDIKLLVIQICVILVASYSAGWLLSRFRQPQVVGEMVAGVLLGPSLLGWLAPGFFAALFPPESLGPLSVLSQIGLLLFMFMIGLELDTKKLRKLGHVAVVISHTSIIVPFALGALLALFLFPKVADESLPFTGFVLFMGAAMSVTAFPVLARILDERNLLGTKLGTLTIACAAVDDVTAWCLLAVIIAIVKSEVNHLPLWQMLPGVVVYLALMLYVIRPVFRELLARESDATKNDKLIVVLLVCMLASSWATEWLGIHALFGAFFAGVIVPKENGFTENVRSRLQLPVVVLLIPLFFAFTGLRTSIGLISGSEMILYCGLVFLVAVAGKFGGSMIAARVMGTPWREAASIGILMNTRGLIELVILNIGLDIGVLTRPLFSIMVLMAVGTTVMTTPLLSLIYPEQEKSLSKHEAMSLNEPHALTP